MDEFKWGNEKIPFFPIPLPIAYLNSKYESFLKEKLKDSKITPTDSTYLVNIYFRETLSQRELADIFFVSEANVAKILKKLEKLGYIEKIKDESNKSRKIIYLTEKGKSTTSILINYSKEWEMEVMEDLSDIDVESIRYILYKMSWNSTKF